MKKLRMKGLLLTALLLLCTPIVRAYDSDLTKNGGYYQRIYDSDGNEKTHSGAYKAQELTYYDTNYNTYSGTFTIVNYSISSSNLKWYYTEGIGDHVCYGSYGLKEVDFNSNSASHITYIGNYTFYGCFQQLNIDLASLTSLESIGDYAFYNIIFNTLMYPTMVY